MTVQPALVDAPLALAVLLILICGWRREMLGRKHKHEDRERQRQYLLALAAERQARAELQERTAVIRPPGEVWRLGEGVGQFPVLAVGTAGSGQSPKVLNTFVRANAEGYIGPVLLAEPDVDHRSDVYSAIAPQVRGKVVRLDLRLLSSGLLGATVSEAQTTLSPYYRGDHAEAVEAWMARVRREARPACLLALISPGGSGVLGRLAIERFKAEFPYAPVYVVLVLDDLQDRRTLNIPELLDWYDHTNLVTGFIVGDNRITDRFDDALALLLPSMVTGPWIDPRRKAGFNALRDVFRVHRVATVRLWAGWLPVHYRPAWNGDLPELFYTEASFAESQCIHGITQVLTDPQLQALPLTPADHPRFLYAALALRPDPDLRALAARVRSDLGDLDRETALSFASIAAPLTPQTEQVPLVVVSLFPLTEGVDGLKAYVQRGESLPRTGFEALKTPFTSTGASAPAAKNGRQA